MALSPLDMVTGKRTAAVSTSDCLDGFMMRERPLSPHLDIYKFAYTMATSIAHRASGIVLAFGFNLLVWWLMAAAAGRRRRRQPHCVARAVGGGSCGGCGHTAVPASVGRAPTALPSGGI